MDKCPTLGARGRFLLFGALVAIVFIGLYVTQTWNEPMTLYLTYAGDEQDLRIPSPSKQVEIQNVTLKPNHKIDNYDLDYVLNMTNATRADFMAAKVWYLIPFNP